MTAGSAVPPLLNVIRVSFYNKTIPIFTLPVPCLPHHLFLSRYHCFLRDGPFSMFPLQPIPTVPATPPREDSANTQVIWDFTQLHLNSHLQGGPQDTLPSGNFLAPPRWVNICQTIKSFSGPIGVCSREDSFSQLASTQDGMGTIVVATNLTCVSLALSVLPFLDFPF